MRHLLRANLPPDDRRTLVGEEGARGHRPGQGDPDGDRELLSAAAMVLTTETLVVDKPEPEKTPAMTGGMDEY